MISHDCGATSMECVGQYTHEEYYHNKSTVMLAEQAESERSQRKRRRGHRGRRGLKYQSNDFQIFGWKECLGEVVRYPSSYCLEHGL